MSADNLWVRHVNQIGDSYRLTADLDTHAQGHWARVVEAQPLEGGPACALKIMRSEHREKPRLNDTLKVYDMFAQEARLLRFVDHHATLSGYANRLERVGFVQPPELAGQGRAVVEWAVSVEEFAQQARQRHGQWLPVLALERIPYERSLLRLAEEVSQAPNKFVPIWEWFDLAECGLAMLAACHRELLFYIDHKLEHSIWDGTALRFIDWNVCEWQYADSAGQPAAWSTQEKRAFVQKDLRHFTGNVLFPLLTNHTIMGARPIRAYLGNVSLEHIPLVNNRLNFYEDRYNSGDQLFDDELKDLLTKAVRIGDEGYASAEEYVTRLAIYRQSWSEAVRGFEPALREWAKKLRQAQTSLAEAEEGLARMVHLGGRKVGSRPRGVYREVGRFYRHVRRFREQAVLLNRKEPS